MISEYNILNYRWFGNRMYEEIIKLKKKKKNS